MRDLILFVLFIPVIVALFAGMMVSFVTVCDFWLRICVSLTNKILGVSS